MPITFRASIDSFRSDRLGESKLTLAIPQTDKAEAYEAGQLTEQIVIVTIVTEGEVSQKRR